jgi:hypothetical protein
MVKPNQSVLHVVLLGYTNSDIATLVWRARRVKGVAAIPHHIRGILPKRLFGSGFPIETTPLVGKEGSKFLFAYQILG